MCSSSDRYTHQGWTGIQYWTVRVERISDEKGAREVNGANEDGRVWAGSDAGEDAYNVEAGRRKESRIRLCARTYLLVDRSSVLDVIRLPLRT